MGWCLHSIEILVEKGGQEEGRSGVREEGGVALGMANWEDAYDLRPFLTKEKNRKIRTYCFYR